ncbi:hypothetical protein GH810_07545 [Acetobacterium paludosum]|uniref:Uncharacterized protein n=1 Tax=Acetobacterium paludosum TaxID=52693 RepID=A0A923HWZ0_9FIRM|nr:hypothetical protein [Acetobacterium paludosum]MBC3888159.1 hypothetical protein [Acetobacterium paludosum]
MNGFSTQQKIAEVWVNNGKKVSQPIEKILASSIAVSVFIDWMLVIMRCQKDNSLETFALYV